MTMIVLRRLAAALLLVGVGAASSLVQAQTIMGPCTPATTTKLGCVTPDGTTITIVGSVISAVGGTGSGMNVTGANATSAAFQAIATAGSSSLTALTLSGTPLGPASGGTGIANNAANTLTFSGNYGLTLTLTGATSLTLPASGTLVNSGVATLSSLASVGTLTTGAINWAGNIATSGGVQIGAPIGGNLGPGSINAAGQIQSDATIATVGSTAEFVFNDRGGSGASTWYHASGYGFLYENSYSGNILSWNGTTGAFAFTRSVQIGSPTGGDEGAGTLNLAGSLYNNGTGPTGSGGGYVLATGPTISQLVLSVTASSAATAGTLCGSTITGGTVSIDTTLACLASDERLKQQITPFAGATAEIMALRPITYGWREGTPKFAGDPGEHIGLGAFATAYVDERLIARDPEGNPRGWREDAMIALLVAGMREQQAEIAALKAKLP